MKELGNGEENYGVACGVRKDSISVVCHQLSVKHPHRL